MNDLERALATVPMREKAGMYDVPCDGCTLCCRGDHIRILPHEDASQWQTIPHTRLPGQRMLARRANGDCIYLGEKGCTIQDTKPQLCKEMDCRRIAHALSYTKARKSPVPMHVWRRGRELILAGK